MLALNASIEASRAGKDGASFSVVASEVRQLARRTTGATAQIAERLARIQSKANDAVEAMRGGSERVAACVQDTMQASDALKRISAIVEQLQDKVTQVASATTEQTVTVAELNQGMHSFAEMVETLSQRAADSTAGMGRLRGAAHSLNLLKGCFDLEGAPLHS